MADGRGRAAGWARRLTAVLLAAVALSLAMGGRPATAVPATVPASVPAATDPAIAEAIRQAVAAKMRYEAAIREAVAARMRYEAAVREAVAAKMRQDAQRAAMQAALTALWTAQMMPGGFADPIPGAWVTSGSGMRWHPVLGVYRCHGGIDLSAWTGRPVSATAAGTVVYTGWGAPPLGGDYGNTVIIDHGGGVTSLYAHFSAFAVPAGSRVSQGQVVGYAGSTGASTGPHLHFEIRFNNAPQQPLGWLTSGNPGLRGPACP